jgi:formimidoylglutamate deiminase
MKALWFRTALLEKGWATNVRIGIEAGRVANIEASVAAAPADEQHAIGVPGMSNVHSHAFQRAMAGLAETAGPRADNFWTWREAMYRFLDAIGPQELEAITAFAFMEMLESGFTRVGEFHYVHHDPDGRPYPNAGELSHRVAAASQETGIGLTLLPVMYAHSNFAGRAPTHGQRRFINDVEQFARIVEEGRRAIGSLQDAVLGVAPHSLRAVTPQELSTAIALVPQGPIHIHAAEQVKEVEDCIDWSGQRPVEWLLNHAPVDARWCVIHATHITPDETRRLAGTEAVAGLCPVTEANLGDGVFPTPAFLDAGGSFGVGSDSNILISPVEELRMLEYAQRLENRSRNVLASTEQRSTGRRLYEAALVGGARALGAGHGRLKVGASADIVSLDPRHASLAGRRGDDILDSWIFAGRGSVVDGVWRHGRKLVSGGRHVDHDRIVACYRDMLEQLLR